MISLLVGIMGASLLVIASTTGEWQQTFFTPYVKGQLRWFALGWLVYLFFAGLDYRLLRSLAWALYLITLLLLAGLFLVPPIHHVHRWYRFPFLNFDIQPSEYAKLVLVLALSRFLESRSATLHRLGSASMALLILLVPFVLILRQPDLGTAMVLYPIALVMFYFGGLHRKVLMGMSGLAVVALLFVSLVFVSILPYDKVRPLASKVLKEYQYERLNPDTYHQRAAQTAIALGGVTGCGWRQSEFTGRHWLPAAHTDSVFAAFAEEFGLVGVFLLMLFYFWMLYCSFQVTATAKDLFGRLLSAGIAVYLAMHVIVNMGMMCGCLPITGVPLILMTYGGSSVLATMTALGILQSIYSRRFVF